VFTLSLSERNEWLVFERVAAENPPSDVLLSTFSASMVQSEGEHQKADCAPNAESMINGVTINDNHRTMDDVAPVGNLKYCEVRGTFVFYSQEGYKGSIRYATDGDKKMLSEMSPEDSTLTRIQSVRIAGNKEKWDADTITFYAGEDFSGNAEMYDDVNPSGDELNNPGSAIITGLDSSKWSLFDEQGNCIEVQPLDPPVGIAKFYRNLRQDLFNGYNIKKVEKGTWCN